MQQKLLVAAFAALVALGTCQGQGLEEELSLLQMSVDSSMGNLSSMLPPASEVDNVSALVAANQTPSENTTSLQESISLDAMGNTSLLMLVGEATAGSTFRMRDSCAEFLATALFIIIGCGAAMAIANVEGAAWVMQVAFAFGFAITVLAYSLGRYSGGQMNCAVTLALWVHGDLGFKQAVMNFIAQLFGSLCGALVLSIMFPKEMDKTGSLACNRIAEGFHVLNVFVGEFFMTFLLVMTVFESGKVQQPDSAIAVIPIGLAVFLAHCVLIPVDGCSINPTRSLGPAAMAMLRDGSNKTNHFRDMWVFWCGPLMGALAATGIHSLFMVQ